MTINSIAISQPGRSLYHRDGPGVADRWVDSTFGDHISHFVYEPARGSSRVSGWFGGGLIGGHKRMGFEEFFGGKLV